MGDMMMNIFKYHDTLIFDSKNLFDRKIGIQSLGNLDYFDYGDRRLAFSGFERFDKLMNTSPFFISLDRYEGIAYIFGVEEKGGFKRFKKNTINLLNYYGYAIEDLNSKVDVIK